MRYLGVVVLLVVMLATLTGCGGETATVWETVDDRVEAIASADPRHDIFLATPADTQEVAAFSNSGDRIYEQPEGDLIITTQVLQAENLESLLKKVTGQQSERLTVMTTWWEGIPRHEVTWTCAGESGMEVCRGVILDDGSFYYAVTTAVPESRAGAYTQRVRDCLSGVTLTSNEASVLTTP